MEDELFVQTEVDSELTVKLREIEGLTPPPSIRRCCDLTLLTKTAGQWRGDVMALESGSTVNGDRMHAEFLPIAEARDPRFVESLIRFNPPAMHPALYLLPVFVAWAFLGLVELRYASQAGSLADGPSFFAWWSDEPVGPAAFSAALATLIGLVALREQWAYRAQSRVRTFEQHTQSLCVELSQLVARTTSRSEADPNGSNAALTAVGTRLETVAGALIRVVELLSADSAPGAEAVRASNDLIAGLNRLDGVMGRFAEATGRLVGTVEQLPAKVASWDEDLESLQEIRTLVGTQGEATVEASRTFTEGVANIVERLPLVDSTLMRAGGLLSDVDGAEERLTATIRVFQEAGESQALMFREQFESLEKVIVALTSATASLGDAGSRLVEGMAVVDGLAELGLKR